MADHLEKDCITIVNFIISNKGEKPIILADIIKKTKTEIPPGESLTFDSAGAYLGYIEDKVAFELAFREGSLIVSRGKALSDGGEIFITSTLK
jgi:hypothetical protein